MLLIREPDCITTACWGPGVAEEQVRTLSKVLHGFKDPEIAVPLVSGQGRTDQSKAAILDTHTKQKILSFASFAINSAHHFCGVLLQIEICSFLQSGQVAFELQPSKVSMKPGPRGWWAINREEWIKDVSVLERSVQEEPFLFQTCTQTRTPPGMQLSRDACSSPLPCAQEVWVSTEVRKAA